MWPSANTVQCVVGFKNEQCCYVIKQRAMLFQIKKWVNRDYDTLT